MANIPIRDIPGAVVASPDPSNLIPMDNGSLMQKTTIANAVNATLPLSSQAEAEAGADNAKRMSSLRTKQAIDAQTPTIVNTAITALNLGSASQAQVEDFATAVQGAKADSAVQPSRTVGAGTGLTGGGDLSANRTISLNSASVASLSLADSSVQSVNGTPPDGSGNVIVDAAFLQEQSSVTTAMAVSFAPTVEWVRTAGYASAGDGGGALYKRALTEPSHPGKFQSADGAWWEYASDVVNVRAFGAKGGVLADNDDTAAITAAWGCAKSLRKPLYFPSGSYIVKSKIVLDAQFNIFGDGDSTVINCYNLNDTIFEIAPTGSNMDYSNARDFRAIANYSSSAVPYDNSAVFKMVGTSSDFFGWSNFSGLLVQGFRQSFWANGSPRTTIYGLENNWSWNTFNNIRILAGTRPSVLGFRMPYGSGTGNEYYDIKGFVGGDLDGVDTNGAVFEFGDAVVGDIIISGGHFGSYSTAPSVLFSAGANTVYRSRISVSNVQLDAGMQLYFSWTSGSVAPSNIKFIGCNVGGGAAVGGLPPVWLSQIHGADVSDQRLGRVITVAATGAANVPYFKVTMAPNSGTVVDVVLTGVVQGVGSSVVYRRVFIRSGASDITEIVNISGGSSPETGAVIGLGTSSSGLDVTMSVQFTSTSPNTTIEGQAILVGGTAFLSEA